MRTHLPQNATVIGLKWLVKEGGFGIIAETDAAGQPTIGVYLLNQDGKPRGQRTEYSEDNLEIPLIVGHDEKGASIRVYAYIKLTAWGLFLRVLVSPIIMARRIDRHLDRAWDRTPPRYFTPNTDWPYTHVLQGMNA